MGRTGAAKARKTAAPRGTGAPRKRCPPGSEVNKETNRCRKKCAPGTVRNAAGRCATGSKRQKTCPADVKPTNTKRTGSKRPAPKNNNNSNKKTGSKRPRLSKAPTKEAVARAIFELQTLLTVGERFTQGSESLPRLHQMVTRAMSVASQLGLSDLSQTLYDLFLLTSANRTGAIFTALPNVMRQLEMQVTALQWRFGPSDQAQAVTPAKSVPIAALHNAFEGKPVVVVEAAKAQVDAAQTAAHAVQTVVTTVRKAAAVNAAAADAAGDKESAEKIRKAQAEVDKQVAAALAAEQAKHAAELARLQKELADQKKALAARPDQTAELQKVQAELANLRAAPAPEVEHLKAELAKMKQTAWGRREQLRDLRVELTAKLQLQRAMGRKLREKYAALQAQIATLSQDQTAAAQVAALQTEKAALEKQIQEISLQTDEKLDKRTDATNVKVAQLESQLAAAEAAAAQKERDLQNKQESLSAAAAVIQLAQAHMQDMEARTTAAQGEITKLQAAKEAAAQSAARNVSREVLQNVSAELKKSLEDAMAAINNVQDADLRALLVSLITTQPVTAAAATAATVTTSQAVTDDNENDDMSAVSTPRVSPSAPAPTPAVTAAAATANTPSTAAAAAAAVSAAAANVQAAQQTQDTTTKKWLAAADRDGLALWDRSDTNTVTQSIANDAVNVDKLHNIPANKDTKWPTAGANQFVDVMLIYPGLKVLVEAKDGMLRLPYMMKQNANKPALQAIFRQFASQQELTRMENMKSIQISVDDPRNSDTSFAVTNLYVIVRHGTPPKGSHLLGLKHLQDSNVPFFANYRKIIFDQLHAHYTVLKSDAGANDEADVEVNHSLFE